MASVRQRVETLERRTGADEPGYEFVIIPEDATEAEAAALREEAETRAGPNGFVMVVTRRPDDD